MRATIHVHYPCKGGKLGLSGTAPLSWTAITAPAEQSADTARFVIDFDKPVDLKVRLDESWSQGRNLRLEGGGEHHVFPHFFEKDPVVEVLEDAVHFQGEPLVLEIFHPPSYGENPYKRYPVLYAQDGQNLFDTPTPTTDVHWHLDTIAHGLMELGLCEEIIIVGVHHRGEKRILDYTPFVDPHHGGGGASTYAQFLIDHVKPLIDKKLRTYPESHKTGVMGSSLGGLFAFYAGRTFPNVFAKVAALSSSFQWSRMAMLRDIKRSTRFSPIQLYLDAGTKGDEMESYRLTQEVVNELIFDGFRLGLDFYALAGVGDEHNEHAWSTRVHFPLLYLFPWVPLGARSREM